MTSFFSFQHPSCTTLQQAVKHDEVYADPNANITIKLTSIKAHQSVKVSQFSNSSICEYINIFTFDYYLT